MNKKMREILALIDAKTAEAKGFMDGENKDVAKATALMDECDQLKAEYEVEKRIVEAQKAQDVPEPEKVAEKAVAAEKADATATFAKAFRDVANKKLVEGTDADGGYTVPEDVTTAVNRWVELQQHNFLNDIDVVKVTTNKGQRTYMKKGDPTVFANLEEDADIETAIEAMQFERIKYAIKDRAGFMPVSNDLLADSDAGIMAFVTEWLGKAEIGTCNAEVLKLVHGNEETDLKDMDGIKKAVIVDLEAFAGSSKIYTNADGIAYLDTLKDKNDRYLLNPDPSGAVGSFQLRCGSVVVPVAQLPKKSLATSANKVPFIVGDLKAGIRKWDRQSMSLTASTEASIGGINAFSSNQTLIRAIMRDDYTALDKSAFINGFITVEG